LDSNRSARLAQAARLRLTQIWHCKPQELQAQQHPIWCCDILSAQDTSGDPSNWTLWLSAQVSSSNWTLWLSAQDFPACEATGSSSNWTLQLSAQAPQSNWTLQLSAQETLGTKQLDHITNTTQDSVIRRKPYSSSTSSVKKDIRVSPKRQLGLRHLKGATHLPNLQGA
jgi:hypothetical protein